MSNAAILSCVREQPLAHDEDVNGEVWTNLGGLYRLEIQPIVPGHEVYYGFQWLIATLAADSVLTALLPGGANGIWRGLAPAGTAAPFVIVAFQAGTDTLTLTGVRLFSQPLYQVKITGPASLSTTLAACAAEIDALLGRSSGSV